MTSNNSKLLPLSIVKPSLADKRQYKQKAVALRKEGNWIFRNKY